MTTITSGTGVDVFNFDGDMIGTGVVWGTGPGCYAVVVCVTGTGVAVWFPVPQVCVDVNRADV